MSDSADTTSEASERASLVSSTGYAALREHEREVLDDLRAWNGKDGWARPMDVGGRDASHHSGTLTKLVKLGFAESRYRGWCKGGSKLYRALPHNNRL